LKLEYDELLSSFAYKFNLRRYTTEELAAQAYNMEAQRLGLPLNVIPPAGDADDGDDPAAPAALALLSLAACGVHTHGGAGSKRKRAGAPTTPAPPQTKKMRLDASAGAAAAVSSQFKDVSWNTSISKWQVTCKGKYLGLHTTQEGAARAYTEYLVHWYTEYGDVPGYAVSSQFRGVS